MMKSLSLVHQTQIRYLGSTGATLLTDIAPINFFGSPLFLFIFSLAIFLVYGFLLSIKPFVEHSYHARAHHHPGAQPCTKILKNFLLRNFVSPFDCICFCGDKSDGVFAATTFCLQKCS
jgi:hypothetical protein